MLLKIYLLNYKRLKLTLKQRETNRITSIFFSILHELFQLLII